MNPHLPPAEDVSAKRQQTFPAGRKTKTSRDVNNNTAGDSHLLGVSGSFAGEAASTGPAPCSPGGAASADVTDVSLQSNLLSQIDLQGRDLGRSEHSAATPETSVHYKQPAVTSLVTWSVNSQPDGPSGQRELLIKYSIKKVNELEVQPSSGSVG